MKETIEDKTTWFNVKHFSIGNVDFTKPEKSLDVKPIDSGIYSMTRKGQFNFKFAEWSKLLDRFESLERLYQSSDDSHKDQMFSSRPWLKETPYVLNFTLKFNPQAHLDKRKVFESFLDQYHSHSNFILTVPNIQTWRKPFTKKGQPPVTIPIATVDDYIKSVDMFYDVLSDKNNKPIFVPISLRMGNEEMDKLLAHYLRTEKFSFWVDFEGRALTENRLGAIRYINRRIKESGRFTEVVTYFTNIRRELMSNTKTDSSPASDVLSAVAGANLVGCNREPQFPSDQSVAAKPVSPQHKARVLNKETYYYDKTKIRRLLTKGMYVTHNAVELNDEFGNQTEHFMSHLDIAPYISQKPMLRSYQNGRVLKMLESKVEVEQPDMLRWIG